MKCPLCEAELERKKLTYEYADVDLGKFDADVCKECGERFFTEEASKEIDKKAKELGVWGLSATTKVGYSGNSLIIRVSKEIADFMKLEKGEQVVVYPEGKDRLVVEVP